jgi:hypothetical protein
MEAAVGDRIVVAATDLGGHMRDGEIIKVGNHGAPPHLVHWFDDGRETLFFPGPDAQSIITNYSSRSLRPPLRPLVRAAYSQPHAINM